MNRREALFAGAALVILLGTSLLSYLDWKEYRQARVEGLHARQVLNASSTLIAAMLDAETGQRGFLLTGEERYLGPYNNALTIIPEQLKLLSGLAHGQQQLSQIRLLEPLVTGKLADIRQTIEARRSRGAGAAAGIVRTDGGKRLMDEIRRVNSQIQTEESSRLAELTRSVEIRGTRTRIFSIAGDVVLFVFLLIAGFSIASAAGRREQLIGELRA